MRLEGLDGLLVMQAEQLLFHAVQQGVRQPLDDIGLIPLPARAVPHKPAFVRVAVAHPLAVSVGKPQCVARVVLCITLVPPRRCGAPGAKKASIPAASGCGGEYTSRQPATALPMVICP